MLGMTIKNPAFVWISGPVKLDKFYAFKCKGEVYAV